VSADPRLDDAVGTASPARRAALFAEAGLWYDAVAAAAGLGQQTALDALMSEVGLTPSQTLPHPGGGLSELPPPRWGRAGAGVATQ
jgi:hypothetical protein